MSDWMKNRNIDDIHVKRMQRTVTNGITRHRDTRAKQSTDEQIFGKQLIS